MVLFTCDVKKIKGAIHKNGHVNGMFKQALMLNNNGPLLNNGLKNVTCKLVRLKYLVKSELRISKFPYGFEKNWLLE